MSIFERYQARYESSREEVMGLDEYLSLCKADPTTYAGPAERLLKAIGEPELVDTRNHPRLSRIFQNKVLRRYPAFSEFYGMEESIEHLVSYLKHAAQGSGGEEADPLPAWSRGRRQVVPGREAEGTDADRTLLRHRGLAGVRVAAGAVLRRGGRANPGGGLRHSAPLPEHDHVTLGGEAAAGVQRGHHPVPRGQAPSVHAGAGGHRQDGAGRREQPGHLVTGR